jgi:hypothetical protein
MNQTVYVTKKLADSIAIFFEGKNKRIKIKNDRAGGQEP